MKHSKPQLLDLIALVKAAGATIVYDIDITTMKRLWARRDGIGEIRGALDHDIYRAMLRSRDYDATRDFINEFEFMVAKVSVTYVQPLRLLTCGRLTFYDHTKSYRSDLGNTEIRTLEDVVQYVCFITDNLPAHAS